MCLGVDDVNRKREPLGQSGPWPFCTINVNKECGDTCTTLTEDLASNCVLFDKHLFCGAGRDEQWAENGRDKRFMFFL